MDFIYLRSQDNRSLKGFRSPSYHVPTHRIVRVVKGEGDYIFPDSNLKVTAGDILLTSPGVRSIDFPGNQEVHLQVVNFSARYQARFLHYVDPGCSGSSPTAATRDTQQTVRYFRTLRRLERWSRSPPQPFSRSSPRHLTPPFGWRSTWNCWTRASYGRTGWSSA